MKNILYFVAATVLGLAFQHSLFAQLTLSADGNLAIGTASTTGDRFRAIYQTSGKTAGYFSGGYIGVEAYVTAGSATRYAVYVGASGGSNAYGLWVHAKDATSSNTSIYATSSTGSNRHAGYFNGNVTVTGTFSSPSDSALKTNIVSLAGSDASEGVMKLRPVRYSYRSDVEGMSLPSGSRFGFIAQEIASVYPELVAMKLQPGEPTGDGLIVDDGEFTYTSMEYLGLIPILVAVVQEQQRRIDNLERIIEQRN